MFHSEFSTLEDEINLLSTLPLLYQPSTEWVYSVSVDVLARIIEIITKNTLQEELQNRIFKPLNMIDTSFKIDSQNIHRLITHYEFDPLQNKLHDPLQELKK